MLRVTVYHSLYGCESGCCGHIVELTDENGKELFYDFCFSHPYNEDAKKFATELAKEKIAEKFPDCLDSIDWDSINFEHVSDC